MVEQRNRPFLVTGNRRWAIGFIEVDLRKRPEDFRIINSGEGLRGICGNVYSYALYKDLSVAREFKERVNAGILNDLGVPR